MQPCVKGITQGDSVLFHLSTFSSCIKKIVQSYGYVGLVGLAFQSNGSNCLVLTPYR